MRTLTQLIENGTPWRLYGTGSYFRVLESVEPVNVRMMRLGRVVYEAQGVEAGFFTAPSGGFDAVEVGTTLNPQRVKVAVSDGTGGYDRYTGTVNMATASSIVNTGVKSVAVVATPLIPADGKRKGIRFLNSGATVVYLGGAGIDLVNGCLKLGPGELLFESEAPSAAWFAVSDGGPGVVKVQELIG
jgi:hypothetical protein